MRAVPGRKAADALPVRDHVHVTPQRNTSLAGFDRALVLVTVGLLALGLVMVYSASIALPDNPKFANYCTTYFLTRQALFLAIGFVAALIALQVPVAAWERWAPWLLRRVAGAAGAGAGAHGRQGRQRCASLDAAGVDELPAQRAGQAGHRDVCRQLHGAQDGREGKLHAGRLADGGGAGGHRPAAAGRAGHGRVPGHRDDRAGHPVPGRRQRPHVRAGRGRAGRRLRADDRRSARGARSASSPTWTRGTRPMRRARPTS